MGHPDLLQIDATLGALGELLAALTEASEMLDAEASEILDTNHRREAWRYALGGLWLFLDKLDPNDADRTKVPISALMTALQDLDQGRVDTGLQPKSPEKGGQPSGYDQVTIRTLAAATMDCLMRAGCRKVPAARIVAKALDENGVPIGNQRNVSIEAAGRAIEKWRERLDRRCDQEFAFKRYSSFKKRLQFPPGTSADDIGAGLPRLLSEVLAGRVKKAE